MKDYLRKSELRNIFPQNPTQTLFMRFRKLPSSELENPLKEIEKEFKFDRLKTRYTQFLGGENG